MEVSNIKAFKLNFSGSFDELSSENILELFSLVNVLAIYIPIQKRMYIWIGNHATQGLKKHIAQTRALFSTQFPELKILRNITIESGSEPSDFFQFIGFTWDDMNAHLKKQEEQLAPILNEINSNVDKQNNLIESESYEEAIKISNKIIELSQKINDEALEREQRDLIEELTEKFKLKTDVDKVKKNVLSVKTSYEKLIETNKPSDIIEAHNLIEELKLKYNEDFDLSIISEAKELFKDEENKWNIFIKDQKFATNELEKLNKKIKVCIEKIQISEVEEILNEAKELLLRISDDNVKNNWKQIETQFVELKIKHVTIGNIEKSIEESINLKNNYQFKEALHKIDSTLEEIQDKDILEYNKKLQELKEELITAEQNFLKIEEEIKSLEKQFNENKTKNLLNAALINCEKIIEKAKILDNNDIILSYTQNLNKIKSQLEDIEKKKKDEQKELLEKANELKKVIEVDENILPLIEDFAISDIIDNLSDDVNEMLEQFGGLLNEHRVEIKEEISTKSLLKSTSGESLELEQEIKIEKKEKEEEDIIEYNVKTGFTNPFDDVIEEAILTDLIPYNYEITDIQLNGEPPKNLPDKTLTKNGLEFEWKIQDIPPNEEININYDLRRRVSRTVIFMLEDQLKIIKTHSKLNTLNLEGLYEAKLPFTNSFGQNIHGLIVEDIIPLYYLHFIKEPQNLIPADISSFKGGDLIKWNIGTLETKTINYQYRLLELYRMEEIKINIDTLSKNGLNALNKGDLTEALGIYDKIINQL
ncbi:MAG: hypothetical protein ACFFAO_20215, partial [Candidatus Hermodarchaeota archaeon]